MALTSTRGPIVAARACSESKPYTATATAIASSYVDMIRSQEARTRLVTHEIIAPSRKRLHNGCFIAKHIGMIVRPAELPRKVPHSEKCQRPGDEKVEDHGNEDAEHRT